jgi:hypothetical protein
VPDLRARGYIDCRAGIVPARQPLHCRWGAAGNGTSSGFAKPCPKPESAGTAQSYKCSLRYVHLSQLSSEASPD